MVRGLASLSVVALSPTLMQIFSTWHSRFWGNNWDSRKDGTICGGCTFLTDPDTLSHLCNGSPWFLMVFFPAVDVITGIQNCNLFPFTVVQNAKNGTVTRGLTYRKLRMEVIDNTVAVFGVHPSGAVYRDEYVSFRFFSVDLFDIQPGLPGTVLPATLFASYPIQRFDNVTQVGDSTFEISVSWSNERIRFLKFIWTLNYQNTGYGCNSYDGCKYLAIQLTIISSQ